MNMKHYFQIEKTLYVTEEFMKTIPITKFTVSDDYCFYFIYDIGNGIYLGDYAVKKQKNIESDYEIICCGKTESYAPLITYFENSLFSRKMKLKKIVDSYV